VAQSLSATARGHHDGAQSNQLGSDSRGCDLVVDRHADVPTERSVSAFPESGSGRFGAPRGAGSLGHTLAANCNRRSHRETIAKANFREFLKLFVEYPEFADGNPNGQQARYEWFVAHLLWAAEEILEFAPADWESNLQLHIRYHRNFLGDPNGRYRRDDRSTYTARLQRFVDQALWR
jgi:hypothetical protein